MPPRSPTPPPRGSADRDRSPRSRTKEPSTRSRSPRRRSSSRDRRRSSRSRSRDRGYPRDRSPVRRSRDAGYRRSSRSPPRGSRSPPGRERGSRRSRSPPRYGGPNHYGGDRGGGRGGYGGGGGDRGQPRYVPQRPWRARGGVANAEPSMVLGIFGLSSTTNEPMLRTLFETHGAVERVSIVYDKQSGASRGFAFIYMADQEGSTKAKEAINGTEIDGRPIRVDYSLTQKPHDSTPGQYMGRKPGDRGNSGGGGGSHGGRDSRDSRNGGGGGRGGYGNGGGDRAPFDRDARGPPPEGHRPNEAEREERRGASPARGRDIEVNAEPPQN